MQLNKFSFANILWFACLVVVLGETLAGRVVLALVFN